MKRSFGLAAVPFLVAALALFAATPERTLAAGAGAVSAVEVAAVPAARYRDLGRIPAGQPVQLAIVLAYRNEPQLQALLAAQNDPRSPQFGRTIPSTAFLDRYAPSAAAYAAVQRDLVVRGFSIARTYANRSVIDVAAPAAVVERAFSTELHRAASRERAGYANVRPAYLPAELRTIVAGVVGFDSVAVLHAQNRVGPPLRRRLGAPFQGPDTGFGPGALASAYDLPLEHGDDGLGQAAAVVIDADYLDADLARFLAYFGVVRDGPATTRVPVGGGPSPAINADSLETTLDVEAIVGTAPGTSLYVYETSSLEYAKTLDAYEQIVSENRVGAVNSSFGGCETETNPSTYPRMVEKIAEQGAALGIVFSASTGDDGSYACSFSGAGGVNAPASAPSFVAVGGTTLLLQQNGAYSLELGWDGSGGGVSSLFARPAYQRGVRGVIGNRRNLPDVAFDADPGSGMSLYFRGRWAGPIGGTSLASPLFTALCTELAQNAGHRIGANVHGSIYGAFAAYGYRKAGTTYFHDATFGSNGSYSAKPGYDQVTGIGSLDGWNVGGVAKLSAASLAARAPAGARFAISLALRDRAGLDALIRSQSDPSSPMYAHFLSARAFRDAFAPTPEQYAATLAALRRAGFTIEATSPNRTLIDVRGTSANLARATRAAFSAIQSIVGTSGVLARTATSALQPSLHAIGATTALQTVGPDGGFAPLAVTAADDFPVRHGVTGKGVTVADVIDGAPDASDLATFAKRFGGRRAPDVTVVPVDGGKGSDVLQPDVDFEWIAAAAPGAKELDYEVPQLGAKEAFDAYTEIVSDDRADVVNASWGTCDSSFVTLALALQPVFAQGAAEGIAFEGVEFGAPCGGWVKPLPMTPGDTADGLAVGGSYATEGTAAQILQQTALIGSDGGVSILVPVPPEQRALSGVSPLGRNAPDLVIPATVNGAGASIYAGGAWVGGGAFVNNAPAAGLLATLQQMKGHRLGAFDRTLDVLFAKRGYGQIFVDITAGCIGAFEGAPICAGRGFDLATGVGGVDGYALGKAL